MAQDTPKEGEDADLINNILPSYHMFQSTISKTLDSSEEDYTREPPNYEMTPISSATSINTPFSPLSPLSSNSMTEFPFPITNQPEDEQIEIWENTILANVHKLKNLAKSENQVAKDLVIKVNVTRKVCQKGKEPDIIDPSDIEFKQGDYIHGFVTIENTSDEPIGFDMVYVVFEGTLIILKNDNGLIDTQKTQVVHKFLNMTDLFASWSFANIDRLTTDNGDPHDWCEGDMDPYDNTLLSLDLKKTFLPHVKYKRFFTFKVPNKLLDDICEYHSLDGHTQLPSSIGFPKYSMKPSAFFSKKSDTVNDLCFLDTSINYSVECRVLGKAHDYNLDTVKNQYVIASENIQPIRVIPVASIYSTSDAEEITRYYRAFVKSIDDIIEFGNTMISTSSSLQELSLSPVSSTDSKLRQLYSSTRREKKTALLSPKFFEDLYQNVIPYKKRSLLGSKSDTLLSLSTPKTAYKINYVPPLKYRKHSIESSDYIVQIPLKLTYHGTGSKSFPEIKSIKPELVVVTIKSDKYPIPVELTHDIFIKSDEVAMIGHTTEHAYFQEQITKPLTKKLKDLTKLIDKVGGENLKIERQLYNDLRSLASLQAKFSQFNIDNTYLSHIDDNSDEVHKDIQSVPWVASETSNFKSFVLNLDIQSCSSKAHTKQGLFFDLVTLVPDCQTCFSIRLHYIKISIKLANGDSLTVKVPLKVENHVSK